ncbi:hypothetical protein A0H81_15014, partial [Grifola frondosa]
RQGAVAAPRSQSKTSLSHSIGSSDGRAIIAMLYPQHDRVSQDYPDLPAKRACGPEHLRASKTVIASNFRLLDADSPSKKPATSKAAWLLSRLRSRSLSELTRQITPPTKNGHAPPPIKS